MYPDLQNLVFKEIPLPMIQVFPYTLYFNLLLENLMVKQGVDRIMDIFLGGSLWTTFSIMDNNPISKASTTYFISLDYHGFIWDLSVYAIALLSLLIIIDLLRERRAKKIILESAEEQARKEYELANY
jgi:TRAP-type C4-dicarboxylate transport system permease small subunit